MSELARRQARVIHDVGDVCDVSGLPPVADESGAAQQVTRWARRRHLERRTVSFASTSRVLLLLNLRQTAPTAADQHQHWIVSATALLQQKYLCR
jgi:hypothetical protein